MKKKITTCILLLCTILIHSQSVYLYQTTVADFISQNKWHMYGIGFSTILIIIGIYFYSKKKQYEEVFKIINYDKLTGLASINVFKEHIKKVLQTAQTNEYEVISIDIDYFKNINKTFGHDVGNEIITTMAETLAKALGISTTRKKSRDLKNLCILPGKIDEKMMLSREYADKLILFRKTENAKDLESVWYNVLQPAILDKLGSNYALHASFGKYVVEDTSEAVDILIDNAHKARTLGKDTLETSFLVYTPCEKKSTETRTNILFKMEQAIENQEFVVVYQPKVDLQTMKVHGAEALVRWFPPNESPIYPDSFIPVFEDTGYIIELDYYVFDKVCAFIKENRHNMRLPLISVNLSAHTVMEARTPLKLIQILEKYGVDSSEIELEVTESAILTTEDALSIKVDLFKNMGFIVSLDDFGAGASSLNRLASLDIDVIKMDKAFIDGGFLCEKKFALVKAVTTIAKDLKVKLVAEGVETEEQASALKELGCDLIQGYYFSKPLERDAFTTLLQNDEAYPELTAIFELANLVAC